MVDIYRLIHSGHYRSRSHRLCWKVTQVIVCCLLQGTSTESDTHISVSKVNIQGEHCSLPHWSSFDDQSELFDEHPHLLIVNLHVLRINPDLSMVTLW